jgi:hypothetical protein
MTLPERIDPGLALDWGAAEFKAHFSAEKLLRLHPHWHLGELASAGGTWHATLKNHATESDFQLVFRLDFPAGTGTDACMRIEFEGAHLDAMVFERSRGRIVVRLVNPYPPARPDLFQLDLWLRGIYGYLGLYVRNTPWRQINRVIMNRVLIPMNPSQRKISIMIYRFTVLEVVVILLIVVGYFFFMR